MTEYFYANYIVTKIDGQTILGNIEVSAESEAHIVDFMDQYFDEYETKILSELGLKNSGASFAWDYDEIHPVNEVDGETI